MIHHTRKENLDSIMKLGLLPKVATAFAKLIPEKDRNKPIIWLKRECEFMHQNCKDCDIFDSPSVCLEVNINNLSKHKLRHIEIQSNPELDWFYYLGRIPANVLNLHKKEVIHDYELETR